MIEVVFLPHPPLAIEKIGEGKEKIIKKTVENYRDIAERIAQYRPHTIIFITPHGNVFDKQIALIDKPILRGDFALFGYQELEKEKKVNQGLVQLIYNQLNEEEHSCIRLDREDRHIELVIDHGVLVPMWFIDEKYSDYQMVHITTSGQSIGDHYKMGVKLEAVLSEVDEKIVVICSGDLSHALKADGPYEYSHYGHEYDTKVIEAINKQAPEGLLSLTLEEESGAAQCGLRSFLMGFGMVDGYAYDSKVLSYEGPFGVGYLIGYISSHKSKLGPSQLDLIKAIEIENHRKKVELEDAYIKVARKSIETYVKTSRMLDFNTIKSLIDGKTLKALRSQKAGAFVTIYKNGELRGCIGTLEPSADSLLEEIQYNSISACSSDPRFNPITESELTKLDIKVDRLFEPEVITDLTQLDVIKYGLIVVQGDKSGVLLPNLEGIDSVLKQITIAKEKAGIKGENNLYYYRFRVERHE